MIFESIKVKSGQALKGIADMRTFWKVYQVMQQSIFPGS